MLGIAFVLGLVLFSIGKSLREPMFFMLGAALLVVSIAGLF